MFAPRPMPLVALLLVLLGASSAWPARASDETALRVVEAPSLRVGAHGALVVELELGAHGAGPLMLTLTAEGEAVAVVRGRLLRDDARDPDARPLRFDVPLHARQEGRTVVHLRADAYVCEARCESVSLHASTVLRVHR